MPTGPRRPAHSLNRRDLLSHGLKLGLGLGLSHALSKSLGSSFGVTPALAEAQSRRRPRSGDHNILIYGDAGNGDDFQRAVGQAMWRDHLKSPFDFAVSTGDNQYLPTTPDVYERVFERPYAELVQAGLPFYQALGNHDLEEGRLVEQLAYSERVRALERGKGGFVLPSENYVVRKPNLTWIFASVGDGEGRISISPETERFLETSLREAQQNGWVILTTHYPLFSTGPRGDNKALQAKLLPLLERYPADFCFSGHEHHAEFLKPWEWMAQAIIGNGREIRPGRRSSERPSLFFMSEIGFARLRIVQNSARLSFINTRNEEVYVTTVQRRVPLWAEIEGRVDDSLRIRARFPTSWSPSEVDAQCGYSSEPTNPVLFSKGWTYSPLKYLYYDAPLGLDMYEGALPKGKSGFATVRFRRKGDARWIYADSGIGEKTGNYDGVSPSDLFPF
jgi:hypothetical protein